MPISINPSQNTYDYQNNLSDSQANVSSNQNTYAQIFNDILELESQNTGDSSDSSDSSSSNGNLASILMGLNNAQQSSSTSPNDLQALLSGILENVSAGDSSASSLALDPLGLSLGGQQSSTGNEAQLQSLLSLLPDLISSSQSTGDDQSSESDTGFPPILQTSGATLPPFNWKPSGTQNA